MITTSAKWDSLASTSKEKPLALVRLYYGDETSYLALAEEDLILEGVRYLGIVTSAPRVVSKIDLETHKHSIGTVSLELSNLEYQPGERFSDNMETLGTANDEGFYNRKVEVRLYLPGMTVWTDTFPLFTGIVRDIEQSRETVKLDLEDDSELIHVDVPKDPVQESDGAGESPLPTNSLGRAKPIVYGDHRMYLGSTVGASAVATQHNNMAPMIDLGIDIAGKKRWLIAGHKLDSIDVIWGYDPRIDRYVQLVSFAEEQNTSAGAIISHTINEEFYDFSFSDGTWTDDNPGEAANWTDKDNAVDKVFSTTSSSVNTGSAFTNATFQIDFPTYDNLATPSEIKLMARVDGTGVHPTQWAYTINGVTVRAFDETTVQEIANVAINASADIAHQGVAAFDSTAILYETYRRIKYLPDDQLMLFASCRGLEYGSWINSRTGHADDGGFGDLIENPAGIIESILRDQMGLGDSDIDESAFNTASTNPLNAYFMAFVVTEDQSTRGLITDICKDSKSFVWQKSDRTWTMKRIEYTYASSDLVISHNEITEHKFPRTPLKKLQTSVEVTYLKNERTKANQLRLSTARSANNESYYNVTQTQGTLLFVTKTVRGLAAATDLRDAGLKNLKALHNRSEGRVDKQYLDLDVGDVIEFSDMPFKVGGEDIEANATRISQTIYKYWLIFLVNRGKDLQFAAQQLHQTS